MRHLLLPFALVLAIGPLAVGCGSETDDDGAGGTGGGGPTLEFKGLTEALSMRQGDQAVITLRWFPAKSDREVSYRLSTWSRDPRDPDSPAPIVEDVTPAESCGKAGCRFVTNDFGLESVNWYALEALTVPEADGEEPLSAGADVVFPAVIWVTEPQFGGISPGTAKAGDVVTVTGDHFLSEPMWDDALRVGDMVIPPALIRSWGKIEVRFEVPEGAQSGPITIRTAAGEGTSLETLAID